MMRLWLCLAGLSGAMAVAAGAIAAHLANAESGETVALAARYQIWHALALLAVACATTALGGRVITAAGWLFTAGIVLFCGSLYVEAATGWSAITAVTPFGGVALIAGWLALALAGILTVKSAAGDRPKDDVSRPPRQP